MRRRQLLLLALSLIALAPATAAAQVFGSERRRRFRHRARARLRRRGQKKEGASDFESGLGMPRGPDRDYDGVPDRLDPDNDEHSLYDD